MSSKHSEESIAEVKQDVAKLIKHINTQAKYSAEAFEAAGDVFKDLDTRARKLNNRIFLLALALIVQGVYLIMFL